MHFEGIWIPDHKVISSATDVTEDWIGTNEPGTDGIDDLNRVRKKKEKGIEALDKDKGWKEKGRNRVPKGMDSSEGVGELS